MVRVRAPKEFWSGLLFLAIGLAGVFFARDYAYGSALRMGPGYLPTVLSWCTAVLGVIVLVRSFIISGPSLEGMDLRPLLLVLLSIIVFGVLIGGVRIKPHDIFGIPIGGLEVGHSGLVLAIIATTIVGGFASRELGRLEMLVLAAGIALFCALVFVVGLGQPMELWPSWWRESWTATVRGLGR